MKKIISSALLILALSFAMQSCNSTKNNNSSKSESKEIANKLKGTWTLSSIDGIIATNAFKGEIPSITFDFNSHKVNGNSGCNQYNGGFSLIGNTFTPTPMMTTFMSCPEVNQENKYIELISKKSTLILKNNNLQFVQNGKTVLVFTPSAN